MSAIRGWLVAVFAVLAVLTTGLPGSVVGLPGPEDGVAMVGEAPARLSSVLTWGDTPAREPGTPIEEGAIKRGEGESESEKMAGGGKRCAATWGADSNRAAARVSALAFALASARLESVVARPNNRGPPAA